MTSGRLACLIVYALHQAGFLNTSRTNEPSKVVQGVIEDREKYGDVACIPDESEAQPTAGPPPAGPAATTPNQGPPRSEQVYTKHFMW